MPPDSGTPLVHARLLFSYLPSFKALSATAASKRPLLQKQSSKNAVQAAIHEDRAAGASAIALCSARALFAGSAGGLGARVR